MWSFCAEVRDRWLLALHVMRPVVVHGVRLLGGSHKIADAVPSFATYDEVMTGATALDRGICSFPF